MIPRRSRTARSAIPTGAFALLALALAIFAHACADDAVTLAEDAVTLAEDATAFTLANGIVTARIEKQSGNVVALQYRGLDLVRRGYWSFVGGGNRMSARVAATVRTNPAANEGARAEVSCKFSYDGKPGTLPCDVDLRYALGRGDAGIFACALWEHRRGDPAFSIGEARYAVKLNADIFDFMAIDAQRRRVMPTGADWDRGTPLNMKEVRRMTTGVHAGEVEHKYDYSAMLAETPAYGWSSTREHVGLWIVNPSMEFIAGGPTKMELTGHLDVNPGGAPTLLNMWLGSHYGGSSLAVAQDEAWTKVIGPFLLYANAAPDHDALWRDALARAAREAEAWPYAWAEELRASERGSVTGALALRDPFAPDATLRNVRVGLSAPEYPGRGAWGAVDWQRDAKFYQFWTRAGADGRFTIRNVRPDGYTLHAFADGVLGEFQRADVVVKAGAPLDLGALAWTPTRFGRTLWEIGTPDRSAAEFRHGDDFWHWGLYLKYAAEFPSDVNFIVGKSDPRRDWNYAQPPHLSVEGRVLGDSTWRITFDLAEVPAGPLTLRLAFCGARGGGRVVVAVNDAPVGDTGVFPEDGVMHRDGIRGVWFERDIKFEASRLKPGPNVIALRSQAAGWHQGVLYDCVRLEGP